MQVDMPAAGGDGDDGEGTSRIIRLCIAAQLKRTGKEMKFVIEGDDDTRAADPSLVRLLVRAHALGQRLAASPGQEPSGFRKMTARGGIVSTKEQRWP